MRIIVNNTMSKKMYFNGIPYWSVGASVPEEIPFYFRTSNGQAQMITIFKRDNSELTFTVESSLDMKNWTTVGDVSTSGIQLRVPDLYPVYLRASTNSWNNIGFRDGSNVIVGGNIMSLLYGSSFNGRQTILPSTYTFKSLFENWQSLTDASELILPAMELTDNCYESMFLTCRSLIHPPKTPATTLAPYCYANLFGECNNMQGSVFLPARRLERVCYGAMFSNCGTTEIIALAVDGFTRSDDWTTDPLWCFMYNTKHPGVLYKDPECDVLNWTSTDRSGVRSDRGWVVEDYQG